MYFFLQSTVLSCLMLSFFEQVSCYREEIKILVLALLLCQGFYTHFFFFSSECSQHPCDFGIVSNTLWLKQRSLMTFSNSVQTEFMNG